MPGNICLTLVIKDVYKAFVLDSTFWNRLHSELGHQGDCIRDIIKVACITLGVEFIICDLNSNLAVIPLIISRLGIRNQVLEIVFYWSSRDLCIGFGTKNVEELVTSHVIQEKRNLRGKWKIEISDDYQPTCKLYDISGWTNGSLQGLSNSVGHIMENKENVEDKSQMGLELIKNPSKFVMYAVSDSEDLLYIKEKFESLVDYVCGVVEVDYKTAFPKGLPTTLGVMDVMIFEQWIFDQIGERGKAALMKLGILNTQTPHYRRNLKLFHKLHSGTATQEEIDKLWEKRKSVFEYLGHSQASVKYLAGNLLDSKIKGAIVNGGRCNNERPNHWYAENTLDNDEGGAYGYAMEIVDKPLGLPTIISYTPNQKRTTLGKILKKYRHDFDGRNWQIIINNEKLTFAQDFIVSKLTSAHDIFKAINALTLDADGFYISKENEDISKIPGEFGVLRRQLQNAIITHEILVTMEKVATKKELKSFLESEVECLIFYPKSLKCDSLEEWIDKVEADKGELKRKNGKLVDDRTRAWFPLHIKDFKGKLQAERTKMKKKAKEIKKLKGETDPEYLYYQARQEALKVFINALYGVICSPYFSIGNTVVANNITAIIRTETWKMAKGLRLNQTITDGGHYRPNEVLAFKKTKQNWSKPGFEVLSNIDTAPDSRQRRTPFEVVRLGGYDWDDIIPRYANGEFDDDIKRIGELTEAKEYEKLEAEFKDNIYYKTLHQVDEIAYNHCQEFWSNYGLDVAIKYEHKPENIALKTAWYGKGDYAFKLAKTPKKEKPNIINGILFKIRGANTKPEKLHPKYELLTNIINGSDEFPEQLEYEKSTVMRVNKWLTVQNSRGYQDLKDVKLGQNYTVKNTAKFNNEHFRVDNVPELKKRKKRFTWAEKLFERYAPSGIKAVFRAMAEDKLRKNEYQNQESVA